MIVQVKNLSFRRRYTDNFCIAGKYPTEKSLKQKISRIIFNMISIDIKEISHRCVEAGSK